MRKWVIFVTDNSLIFILLSLCLFAISLFIIKDLNVEAFPDSSPPMVEIVSIYEGKSAEEVEKRITLPIEIALASMRGLERINSASLYGLSDIKCKFSYDLPYLEARQEVINRLTNVNLPDGVQPSLIPSPMGEVYQYVLYGSNNLMELRTLQDWTVGRYLKTAQGVADVASYGGVTTAQNVYYSRALNGTVSKFMGRHSLKFGMDWRGLHHDGGSLGVDTRRQEQCRDLPDL